jgi:hypothetical protein
LISATPFLISAPPLLISATPSVIPAPPLFNSSLIPAPPLLISGHRYQFQHYCTNLSITFNIRHNTFI